VEDQVIDSRHNCVLNVAHQIQSIVRHQHCANMLTRLPFSHGAYEGC